MISYQRNLIHRTYLKLNIGLNRLHQAWGYGCPIGMKPIPLNYRELEEQRYWEIVESRHDIKNKRDLQEQKEKDNLEKIRALCSKAKWTDKVAYEQFLQDSRKHPYWRD